MDRPAMFLRTALLATSLLLAAPSVAAKGQLQTRQTGVDLPAGVRAGRLVLANTGDAMVAAQVRVYAWTQVDGEDVLSPSPALTASPAIVEIAPGAEQLVRVIRADGSPVTAEQAYRVIIDERPGDPDKDATNAVTVRMRYVLPVFVRADNAPAHALDCRIGGASLTCRNTGGRAAQLGATTLVGSRARSELTPGLLGYVLAGSSRRFALDAAKVSVAGTPVSLQLQLNGQPTTVALGAAP